ncbi:hypothetical protein FJ872_33180 [Mesorhizobium sp. B2-5-9]|uniref:hypothetical protein n=1 Tax=Mesorhizobium sp. B2-5-9 TaxID=2589921 RepID=UPI00112E5998|nr:hypothetical protein [Mesorhizobium sp. B2-5-9]TPJ95060.1 hypothetical protein FJ872_33180 [Mesorhizobium sp. B2-5-9]
MINGTVRIVWKTLIKISVYHQVSEARLHRVTTIALALGVTDTERYERAIKSMVGNALPIGGLRSRSRLSRRPSEVPILPVHLLLFRSDLGVLAGTIQIELAARALIPIPTTAFPEGSP